MSRSYKKNPWCGDNKGKEKKRCASQKVRSWSKQNKEDILKGKSYKKLYESWDICDFGWTTTWEEYWEAEVLAWEKVFRDLGKPFPDRKAAYREWLKHYKIK